MDKAFLYWGGIGPSSEDHSLIRLYKPLCIHPEIESLICEGSGGLLRPSSTQWGVPQVRQPSPLGPLETIARATQLVSKNLVTFALASGGVPIAGPNTVTTTMTPAAAKRDRRFCVRISVED